MQVARRLTTALGSSAAACTFAFAFSAAAAVLGFGCRMPGPGVPDPGTSSAPSSVKSVASASASSAPVPSAIVGPTTDPRLCVLDPQGWCPAPEGDPCGAHTDVASCKADAHCGGVRYRGESVIACNVDERGFGMNCPTVGCVSLPH